MQVDAVVIDLETNGLSPSSSVLQFTAFFLKAGKVIGVLNRYYFPKEELNPNAFAVHGLDENRIALLRKRQNAGYPLYFDADEELLGFLKKTMPGVYLVAYNLDFEKKFLSHRGIEIGKGLDMMKLYTPLVGIRHPRYGLKYPKLEEAVAYLKRRVKLPNSPSPFHNALVDTFWTYRLFRYYPYTGYKNGEFIRYFFYSGMFSQYPFHRRLFRFWKSWKEKGG